MKFVATLAASASGALDAAALDRQLNSLRQRGVSDLRHAWIEQGRAADIFFAGIAIADAYGILRPALDTLKTDVIIQPVESRAKKLLLADMESTIIEQEMLDEMANMIGVGERVSEITRRAMNGELDFVSALKERVGLLAGQPASMLDRAAALITPMQGASGLVSAIKKHGGQCWLVSGGFTCFADLVARQIGFDRVFANRLEIENGALTGNALDPILDKSSKKNTLDLACAELGLTLARCLTVGDGANDIPMLNACNDGGGLGVAYRAKPAVRAAVPHQINHTDLSTVALAIGG